MRIFPDLKVLCQYVCMVAKYPLQNALSVRGSYTPSATCATVYKRLNIYPEGKRKMSNLCIFHFIRRNTKWNINVIMLQVDTHSLKV
jgi:hypothetical protein